MLDTASSCPRGAGGQCRPPRSVSRSPFRSVVALLGLLAAAPPADAAPVPHLSALLKAARVAVAGEVTATTSYDDDRVAVVALRPSTVFKGSLGTPPRDLSLAELHEGSNAPPLAAGARGLFFLRPATRTSYLDRTLPAGSYSALVPEYGAFIAAADAADAARQVAIMQRVVRIAGGATLPAAESRQLTFDLLAASSPVLVDDGAAGLAGLGAAPALSEAEVATLRTTLLRAELPDRVRIAVIRAVADARLTAMVPALGEIASPPPVMEAAWRALDALGAGPSDEALKEKLASADASARQSAARELLARDGAAAVEAVTPLAVKDADPAVRLAVVEALGALKDPAALPPLEVVFADQSVALQQAAARGIIAVGGQPAIDVLGRLAETGPVTSQRYAVLVMMTLDDPRSAPVLEKLGKTHPDEKVREMIDHGLPAGHKH